MTDSPTSTHQPRFYPFDSGVIIYSLLMISVILILGRPLSQYYDELSFYSFTTGLAVLIVNYLREDRSRIEALVRLLYPAILFTFFYRTTDGTMFLVFDRFKDLQLAGFEASILGVNPTLYIDKYLLNPWVTELLSFCYFSYYLMIPVFLLILFFTRREELLKQSQTAILVTFFFSYMLFFLYPIEGPRWHFASVYENAVTGFIFRDVVNYVIATGAVRGGCMPSTHFAVAVVILMYCFRHFKKTAYFVLPVVLGLGAGTVWGRFHYVSDVIVGGAIAVASTLIVWHYYDKRIGKNSSKRLSRKTTTSDVS